MHMPFRGAYYYEWQIGPLVFQIGRRHPGIRPKRLNVWRDPFWRA